MSQPLTTIVGGGLAGISAALDLTEQGLPVRLIESKRRLGGRTGSFVTSDNVAVDYCQHVGMGCCHNLQRLISMLGQTHLWERHEVLHFFSQAGYRRLAALPLLPAPLHLATWLWKWPSLSLTDRISVMRGLLSIRAQRDLPALDDISAMEWLEGQRQSPAAIQHFWATIIVSALGEELERVSLSAVCKVLQDGFLNDRRAFHLLVPQQPLDALFNEGAATILKQRGVEILTSTPVEEILPCAGPYAGNRFQIRCRNQTLESDGVILAVPWHQLGKLKVQTRETRLEPVALASSPITGVHTWWDQPWLPTPHATIVGQLCQWVFPAPSGPSAPASELANSSSGHYYQIVISASRDLPGRDEADIARLIQSDLSEVFPQVADRQLLQAKIVTDPMAVFSVSPGSLRQRPSTYLEPGLHLAGDWTNTGWPSTMEGAILSGFSAAKLRIQEVKQAPQPPSDQ